MDHDAVLEFDYGTRQAARRVEHSVRLEAGVIEGGRTAASVRREGATVTVTVEAADLVALRAGLNTWLRLVSVAERAASATPA